MLARLIEIDKDLKFFAIQVLGKVDEEDETECRGTQSRWMNIHSTSMHLIQTLEMSRQRLTVKKLKGKADYVLLRIIIDEINSVESALSGQKLMAEFEE